MVYHDTLCVCVCARLCLVCGASTHVNTGGGGVELVLWQRRVGCRGHTGRGTLVEQDATVRQAVLPQVPAEEQTQDTVISTARVRFKEPLHNNTLNGWQWRTGSKSTSVTENGTHTHTDTHPCDETLQACGCWILMFLTTWPWFNECIRHHC